MTQRRNVSLRNARHQRNLTISQLAEAAKVGASTVWRAEHGYVIGAESRQRLCTYFGLTAQELSLAEANSALEQDRRATEVSLSDPLPAEPKMAPAGPAFALPLVSSIDLDPLFYQQSQSSSGQQLSILLALGSQHLASLYDAGWTLEGIIDALRVVLQGMQGLTGPARNALLHMTSSTLVQSFMQPVISNHLSHEEKQRLSASLAKSIDDGWHLFHKAPPMQVMVVAQTLLLMLQQSHSFVPAMTRPTLYTAIYNLYGASLLFQGNYEAARRVHEKAHIAALEGADTWAMAQSLNWQAIVAQVSGDYREALQLIDSALRLLGECNDEPSLRLRAHLLADWAYNAAHLPERAKLQERLEASAQIIKPLKLDEEFDYLQWQQIAGSCFLLRGKYSQAIDLLESSLAQLPAPWLVRRLLTLFPLAEAFAHEGERDASLETGLQIMTLLEKIDAQMFHLRSGEYCQVLYNTFPHDQRVQQFIAQAQHRPQLSARGSVSKLSDQ